MSPGIHINSEYWTLSVTARLSSQFLGNARFPLLSCTHTPNWHLNAVHLNTALHAHYFSPQFTGVSKKKKQQLENATIFLPCLLKLKGIPAVIKAVMLAALWLDSNYCGCLMATEMANKGDSNLYIYTMHTKKRQSDERWFTMSIIFVTACEYLRRWKK